MKHLNRVIRTTAISRLQTADLEFTDGASGTASTLLGVTATYLGVVAVLISGQTRLPSALAVFVPVPLALFLMYHMVLVAAVMERSASAGRFEEELMILGCLPAGKRAKIGIRTSDEVFDLGRVFGERAPWYRGTYKFLMAFLPYVGWYIVALVVTAYVLLDRTALNLPSPVGAGASLGFEVALWSARVTASIFWLVIIAGAVIFYIAPVSSSAASPSVIGHRSKLRKDGSPEGDEARLSALIQLHWADLQHHRSGSSTSVALCATSLAYGAVLASSYRADASVSPFVFMGLSLPPLLLVMYEVLVLIALGRRARSALLLEDMIFDSTGLPKSTRASTGSRASDAITKALVVAAQRRSHRKSWTVRLAAASLPVAGWFAFVLGATILNVLVGFDRYWSTGGRVATMLFASIYAVMWSFVALAPFVYLRQAST